MVLNAKKNFAQLLEFSVAQGGLWEPYFSHKQTIHSNAMQSAFSQHKLRAMQCGPIVARQCNLNLFSIALTF